LNLDLESLHFGLEYYFLFALLCVRILNFGQTIFQDADIVTCDYELLLHLPYLIRALFEVFVVGNPVTVELRDDAERKKPIRMVISEVMNKLG
jgi:hypothetical protein